MSDPMVFLEHLRRHCTGEWRVFQREGRSFWLCSGCRAMYHDTERLRAAALREIRSGEQLGQLAREGTRLLRNER